MVNLKEYLDSEGLKPDDIAIGTGLPIEMINAIICGDKNIMDVDLGSVLLLCQYLNLPLSDFAGYCASQGDTLQITTENGSFYLTFTIGKQEFRKRLCPVTETNTKYIKIIANVNYISFLDDIIGAEKIRIIEYRKQVEREMKKLAAPDLYISFIDDEILESLLDAGCSPDDAAKTFYPTE